ncbi:MAG: F0F1 ATP synthase subunit A, partial [Actinobacteria bacterium]|nr:F0F1 ATP synthase subunit A [Actinomycetota bacterium]
MIQLLQSTKGRLSVALAPLALLLANPAGAAAVEINEHFKPQNEFKLDPWIEIKIGPIDLSINKAVFLLLLAGACTVFSMLWIARRMQSKPNRVQFVVETAYDLIDKQVTSANIKNTNVARRWFGFLLSLFFFVWFSNILGFLPLPINTEHTVTVLGMELPTLQLYAATANLSVPLALALVIFVSYHAEGIREHGPIGYIKTWAPSSATGVMRGIVWAIEALSHLLRLVSLSVRLFANMLAGHMLILIMGGGMIVLLGSLVVLPTLAMGIAFFLFE